LTIYKGIDEASRNPSVRPQKLVGTTKQICTTPQIQNAATYIPKTCNSAVLKSDGILPEITDPPVRVLKAVQEKDNFKLNLQHGEAEFHCIEKYGTNLPENL